MAEDKRSTGLLELKFNGDRTQAIATVHPPRGADAVTAADILERLKSMGVTYGIREQAIIDTIRTVSDTDTPVQNVVVAQGIIPQDGRDARVVYQVPQNVLAQPLPLRADGSGLPDWFRLETAKMVKAGTELATILPAQSGVPGKTLTWPIQAIAPRAGLPCTLRAGDNVHASADGQHLFASNDGYACLHNDRLTVYALRLVEENVMGGVHAFSTGAVFMHDVEIAEMRAGSFVAIRGNALGCRIRAFGDIFLNYAEECSLIASGNVYVTQELKNCHVKARGKVIALENARLSGGTICAAEGVEAIFLGAPDFTSLEIEAGLDKVAPLRAVEIQEEIAACNANIARIQQALKPFASLAAHESLTEDKRQLLQRLQMQRETQETRINELHNEKRSLAIAAKAQIQASVVVSRTLFPGVWITLRKAAMLIESPIEGARIVEASGGKSLRVESLSQAA